MLRGWSWADCRNEPTGPRLLRQPSAGVNIRLRHQLLPQPGGFEGPRAVGEPLDADRLAVAECNDQPVAESDACAAGLATGLTPSVRNDGVVPGFDDFAQLVRVLLPSSVHLDVEVPDGLGASNRCVLRPFARRNHHSVRSEGGEPGLLISPVEGVDASAHRLDVLLRHRYAVSPL